MGEVVDGFDFPRLAARPFCELLAEAASKKYYVIEAFDWSGDDAIVAFYSTEKGLRDALEQLASHPDQEDDGLAETIASYPLEHLLSITGDDISCKGGDGGIYVLEKTGTVDEIIKELLADNGTDDFNDEDDEDSDDDGINWNITKVIDKPLTPAQVEAIVYASAK